MFLPLSWHFLHWQRDSNSILLHLEKWKVISTFVCFRKVWYVTLRYSQRMTSKLRDWISTLDFGVPEGLDFEIQIKIKFFDHRFSTKSGFENLDLEQEIQGKVAGNSIKYLRKSYFSRFERHPGFFLII